MNYIAHIHLAYVTNTSMVGNFLGDFVKGQQYKELPLAVAEGVLLHRKIDQFTDTHPDVIYLKNAFPTDIRRMAGVAIDVHFDHLLLSHWGDFCDIDAESLLQQFYRELNDIELPNNRRFQAVKNSLLEHQWLIEYQDAKTCLNAFYSIERRLKNRIIFAEAAWRHISATKDLHIGAFGTFYQELTQYCAACTATVN